MLRANHGTSLVPTATCTLYLEVIQETVITGNLDSFREVPTDPVELADGVVAIDAIGRHRVVLSASDAGRVQIRACGVAYALRKITSKVEEVIDIATRH